MQLISPNKEPRVLTSSIYEKLGYRSHAQLKEVINEFKSDFESLGSLPCSKSITTSTLGGRPSESYELNLNQFLLLITLVKATPENKNLRRKVVTDMINGFLSSSIFSTVSVLKELDVDLEEDAYIYVAKEEISGRYKIGISKDPKRRIAKLNTGNPEQLVLVHAYLASDGVDSERAAHVLFDDNRLKGEWFDSNIDLSLLPSYLNT